MISRYSDDDDHISILRWALVNELHASYSSRYLYRWNHQASSTKSSLLSDNRAAGFDIIYGAGGDE